MVHPIEIEQIARLLVLHIRGFTTRDSLKYISIYAITKLMEANNVNVMNNGYKIEFRNLNSILYPLFITYYVINLH